MKLTESELFVMNALWDKPPVMTRHILARVSGTANGAYTIVTASHHNNRKLRKDQL